MPARVLSPAMDAAGLLLAALAALAALAVVLASPAAFAAPNIVVVLTDDQDATSVAYMPKLHKLLAEEGITFSNSFVDYSLCAPSRASFLTGQAAHNHGIRSNSPGDTSAWESFRPKEGSALPVWLEKAGYRTGLLGKYINGYGKKRKSERLSATKNKNSESALARWTASLFNRLTDGGQPTGLDWVPEGWDLWYAFAGGVGYYSYTLREGARALDPGLDEMARAYRLTPWSKLRNVTLPQLQPYFAAASRSGISLIWKIVLVVELLGRPNGVGFELHLNFQLFNVTAILGYTVAFVAVMLAIEYLLVQPLERRTTRWRNKPV